jgi:hypothetical protein
MSFTDWTSAYPTARRPTMAANVVSTSQLLGGGPCACSSMLMGRSAFVGVLGEVLRRADRTID